jgi:hypothetical protein
MTDSNVVPFPKDQRDTQWWESTPVLVSWDVRREPNVPVITAVGTILVERDEPLDDGTTDDDYHEKAGEIRIAKAFVDTTDIVLAMDGLTSDHEFLASQIIDGTFYEQEFADWFDDEFGVMLGGDPVFVLDLVIDEKHRDADCLVAAHAALDALSTFAGSRRRWSRSISRVSINAAEWPAAWDFGMGSRTAGGAVEGRVRDVAAVVVIDVVTSCRPAFSQKRVTLPDRRDHERQKFRQGPCGRRRIGVEVRHRQ